MAKALLSVSDRFWSKAIPEPNSGCWLWTGAVNSNGYGSFGIGSRKDKTRKIVTASRLAYQLTHGEVTDQLHILHSCDNALCVNPDHLSAGTRSRNMQEAYDRGMQPFRGGSQNSRAKLTDDIVREIRKNKISGPKLAKELGCSTQIIYAARSGKTWRHVDG